MSELLIAAAASLALLVVAFVPLERVFPARPEQAVFRPAFVLFRFHAVHHSAEHLDWLAAHREHPLDGVLTQLAQNLPAFVLGVPFDAIAGFAAFRGMWAIFVHSNVRLPLGPLRLLLGAPELHHWHHARVRSTLHNFANLAPWLDLAFGTYHRPLGPETYGLGLHEPWPRGYLAQLLRPFRSGRSDPRVLEPSRCESLRSTAGRLR